MQYMLIVLKGTNTLKLMCILTRRLGKGFINTSKEETYEKSIYRLDFPISSDRNRSS
jgi:hypothetical protein